MWDHSAFIKVRDDTLSVIPVAFYPSGNILYYRYCRRQSSDTGWTFTGPYLVAPEPWATGSKTTGDYD